MGYCILRIPTHIVREKKPQKTALWFDCQPKSARAYSQLLPLILAVI